MLAALTPTGWQSWEDLASDPDSGARNTSSAGALSTLMGDLGRRGGETLDWGLSHAGSRLVPLAHNGFMERVKTVPIEAIYRAAAAKGKHLVLTGHR